MLGFKPKPLPPTLLMLHEMKKLIDGAFLGSDPYVALEKLDVLCRAAIMGTPEIKPQKSGWRQMLELRDERRRKNETCG